MAHYAIAKAIEAKAVDRARNAIQGVLAMAPDVAAVRQRDGAWPNLRRIAEMVRLSRATHAALWQNISSALGIKAVFLVLARFGGASMWMAVFADMGASLLVVGNGLRLLKVRVQGR